MTLGKKVNIIKNVLEFVQSIFKKCKKYSFQYKSYFFVSLTNVYTSQHDKKKNIGETRTQIK